MKRVNYIFYNDLIDFKKVIGVELWAAANKDKDTNIKIFDKIILLFKLFLRTIYNSVFSTPSIKFPENKIFSIFYIRAYSRPDLDKHSSYYENIDSTSVCIFKKRKINIDLFPIIKCSYLLFKSKNSWLKAFKYYNVKFFTYDGIKIFIRLFDALSDVVKTLPVLLKHKKLVSFQEHVTVENILCQIANLNEINTFALQHAICNYDETGSYESRYPIVTYLNSVSKNILVWGNYNKDIFKKHTDAKIFIIGKASLPDENPLLEGATIIFENKEFNNSNNKLLSLSYDLINAGIPTSKWFKPGNILIDGKVTRDGPLRKIVIGSNSSMLVELGYLGFNVFVIDKSNIKNKLPKNFIVSDIDSVLKNSKSLESYQYHIWKNFIECTGEECVKRYKNILLKNY